LTNASGNPLNGSYNITARLYDALTGGTELCGAMYSVMVTNGLFNMNIDNCEALDISGAQLYLGIKVGDDPEMTPRQPIYPVPYAWSLRPGAIINNTAASGHGLEVISTAGSGASGTALWAENSDVGGIALWASNSSGTSADASLVTSNNGTGPLLKGFGGDGGEDEFRVNNNGAILSNADSYLFVPGTEATLNGISIGGAELKYGGIGQVVVFPSTIGLKNIQFGIVLPSVLYGQPVKVEEVTIFYSTTSGGSYIDNTMVVRQKTNGAYYTLVDDPTDRGSTTYTSYSVTPTADNTLSAEEGFISIYLTLNFSDVSHSITFGGVRIQLGHGLE
jgi:hypothetical protein